MKTITKTEFNQRISAVAREVQETGEPVRVTDRGRPTLRLIPEPSNEDPLENLFEAGLAAPAKRPMRPIGDRAPIRLSRDLDEIIEEVRADPEI